MVIRAMNIDELFLTSLEAKHGQKVMNDGNPLSCIRFRTQKKKKNITKTNDAAANLKRLKASSCIRRLNERSVEVVPLFEVSQKKKKQMNVDHGRMYQSVISKNEKSYCTTQNLKYSSLHCNRDKRLWCSYFCRRRGTQRVQQPLRWNNEWGSSGPCTESKNGWMPVDSWEMRKHSTVCN